MVGYVHLLRLNSLGAQAAASSLLVLRLRRAGLAISVHSSLTCVNVPNDSNRECFYANRFAANPLQAGTHPAKHCGDFVSPLLSSNLLDNPSCQIASSIVLRPHPLDEVGDLTPVALRNLLRLPTLPL